MDIFRQRFLRNYLTWDYLIWYKALLWKVVLCNKESPTYCLSVPIFLFSFSPNKFPLKVLQPLMATAGGMWALLTPCYILVWYDQNFNVYTLKCWLKFALLDIVEFSPNLYWFTPPTVSCISQILFHTPTSSYLLPLENFLMNAKLFIGTR